MRFHLIVMHDSSDREQRSANSKEIIVKFLKRQLYIEEKYIYDVNKENGYESCTSIEKDYEISYRGVGKKIISKINSYANTADNDNCVFIILYVGHGLKGSSGALLGKFAKTRQYNDENADNFNFTKWINSVVNEDYEKWFILDCCYSDLVRNMIKNGNKALGLYVYGENGSQQPVMCPENKVTNFAKSISTYDARKDSRSFNDIVEELNENNEHYVNHGNDSALRYQLSSSSDYNGSEEEYFIGSVEQVYPGIAINHLEDEKIDFQTFIKCCSTATNAFIVSHRTGSVLIDSIQKTLEGMALIFRNYCSDIKSFKDDFKNIHGLPPLFVYVLSYPGINEHNENVRAKCIYNFLMLKKIFQAMVLLPPDLAGRYSLLTQNRFDELNEENHIPKEAELNGGTTAYAHLLLLQWLSYRVCFVVHGLPAKALSTEIFNHDLRNITGGPCANIIKHIKQNLKSDGCYGDDVTLEHVLPHGIPGFLHRADFENTSNVKESISCFSGSHKVGGNDTIDGFGVYSTIKLYDLNGSKCKHDCWNWRYSESFNDKYKANSDYLKIVKMSANANSLLKAQRLVYFGSLHKILFSSKYPPHPEMYNGKGFNSIKDRSEKAYNHLRYLGFSFLSLAEFLAEPSFIPDFPNNCY